ncbi:MAG: TldD/PmbA family protein [Proteobacteria bacterium]|nr:TldD/PmbA family protein [Pseudomonadota bacterium]
MINIDHLSIIKKLSENTDFGEIYQEDVNLYFIENENGKIEKCFKINDAGFSIRTFLKGNIFFSSSNNKSPEEMLNLHLNNLNTTEKREIKLIENHLKSDSEFPNFYFHDKLKMINEIYNHLKIELKEMINSKITLQYYEKKFTVSNTDGIITTSEIFGERLSIHITCIINNEKFTVFESTGKTFDPLKVDEIYSLLNKSINRTKKMYLAKPCPAGMLPCILSSESGGTLIHEAVGHGLEADLIDKGISIYKDKLGEKVASSLITVVDDSTYNNGWGAFLCDDEGTPAQKTVLIEKGILQNYLYDKYYAYKHKKTSTGNGRRQSYSYRPFPRMTNTLILQGTSKADELIKSFKRGILVNKMGGGQVNTLTGDFIFDVQEGYYIENGEIVHPIKQASIIGNGPKVLSEVEAVCDDFGTAVGTCGKEGQGVPVGDGQPTLLIPSITIGGTAF